MPRAYYNEIDPAAAAWLRQLIAAGLIPDGDVDERDIRDVRPFELLGYTQCHFFAGIGGWALALRWAGWPDDWPVWTGSCPCQPFSSAGRGDGFADERHLWPHWHHLISECAPPVVFGEQVASKDGLAWLDLVFSDLEGSGHALVPVDLCAAGVGAPHIRQRLWIVAYDLRLAAAGLGDGLGARLEGYGRHVHGRGEPGWFDARAAGPVAAAGAVGKLADLHHAIAERAAREGSGPDEAQGRGPLGQLAGRGDSGGVADCSGAGRGEERPLGGGGAGRDRAQGVAARPDAGGGPLGLADLGGVRRGGGDGPGGDAGAPGDAGRPAREWERLRAEPLAGGYGAGALAHGGGGGRHTGEPGDGRGQEGAGGQDGLVAAGRGGAGRAGPVNGFWGDADWLLCRDEKWRPVEPGTFPLADGLPARVVRLRGYGNAISPVAGAIFISEALGALEEVLGAPGLDGGDRILLGWGRELPGDPEIDALLA